MLPEKDARFGAGSPGTAGLGWGRAQAHAGFGGGGHRIDGMDRVLKQEHGTCRWQMPDRRSKLFVIRFRVYGAATKLGA